MDRSQRDLFTSSEASVLTVSELAAQARALLEERFPFVRVTGEISGATLAASGHAYFDLTDGQAVFPAVMFRSAVTRVGGLLPPDGTAVECLGRVTLYVPRGRAQLVVEWLAPKGAGALSIQLLQRKAKLEAEGLFAAERKRALPPYPRGIAVITSPTGAAIHDILAVLAGRFPSIPVLIGGVRVQGAGAGDEIAVAIRRLGDGRHGDVLILARGGGSAEDLSAFNEEAVVRAVAASRVPVISAVGHEVDVVLCDLAADVRAPTPTAAAEAVVPDREEVRRQVRALHTRCARMLQLTLERTRLRWLQVRRRMRDPRLVLAPLRIRLDEQRAAGVAAVQRRLAASRSRLAALRLRLAASDARARLARDRAQAQALSARLTRATRGMLRQKRQHLVHRRAELESLGPQRVLSRGYALVTGPDGRLVRAATQVHAGEAIGVRLAEGGLEASVTRVSPKQEEP
jgi:exodeoxyribonuclease VII large subunit